MSDDKGKTIQIRNKASGVIATADPALAGELIARGGWEKVTKAKAPAAPKPKDDDTK